MIKENGNSCKPRDIKNVFNTTTRYGGSMKIYLSSIYEWKKLLLFTSCRQWDLLCGKEWRIATAQMVHMFGILVGSATVGIISDRYGRKPCIYGFLVIQLVSFILQALAPYYSLFLAVRFVTAFTIPVAWIPSFSYAGEMTTAKYRTIITGLYFIPHAIGYGLLSPLAYLIPDWRAMTWPIAVLHAPILMTWFWFLESPRWLVVNGHFQEAARLLCTVIPKRNGASLPPNIDVPAALERIAKIERKECEAVKTESFRVIFQYPKLMIRAFIIILLWFANNMVYYGVSLNSVSFSGNIFLNNSIFALVEIPSYFLATAALKIGRKRSQFLLLSAAGVSLILVPWADGWFKLLLGVLGKLAIAASFAAIYVFTLEIYPTVIRNTGLGISSMSSRVGGMVAPYLAIMSVSNGSMSSLPVLIYGIVSLTGALLVLLLPETINRPLPDTFLQALN